MKNWKFPDISSVTLKGGDMPGDKIEIGMSHIKRAETIIPKLDEFLEGNTQEKVVISVYGGSGVGKSEIGSLLAYYLREAGHPTYLLSGDNYPYRVPEDNDRERLRVFRYGVLKAFSESNVFSRNGMSQLQEIWEQDSDFSRDKKFWEPFIDSGVQDLSNYLSTDSEVDFSLINWIVEQFKKGKGFIPLKRMGRAFDSVFMEPIDFSTIKVLIIEWTHGNNPLLNGVDYPIFLYSTPEETLAHRLSRARDKGVDSPFVSMVLEVEQKKLLKQLDNAKLIISLNGEILTKDHISV